MSKARKINRFEKRLYDEFEDHAYKVLGLSGFDYDKVAT